MEEVKQRQLSVVYETDLQGADNLNFRNMASVFGSHDGLSQIIKELPEKDKLSPAEILVGEDFGGRKFIPTSKRVVTLNEGLLIARNTTTRVGIGPFALKNNVSWISSMLEGKELTALCAYIAKVAPFTSSPTAKAHFYGEMPSEGVVNSLIKYYGGNLGKKKVNIRFRLDDQGEDLTSWRQGWQFDGRVAVASKIEVERLPESVVVQGGLLEAITEQQHVDDLYGAYGVKNDAHLRAVWRKAMKAETAKDAALSVRNSLS